MSLIDDLTNKYKQLIAPVGNTLSGIGNSIDQGVKNAGNAIGQEFQQLPSQIANNNIGGRPIVSPQLIQAVRPLVSTFQQGIQSYGQQEARNPLNILSYTPQAQQIRQQPYNPVQANLNIGKATLAGLGLASAPLSVAAGGLVNAGFNALGNLAHEQPIDKNVGEAFGKGSDFAAQVGPIGQALSDLPVFTKVAQGVAGKLGSSLVSKYADKIGAGVGNVLKEATTGAVYSGLQGENPAQGAVQFAPYGLIGAGKLSNDLSPQSLKDISPRAFKIDPHDQEALTDIISKHQAGQVLPKEDIKLVYNLGKSYLGEKYTNRQTIPDLMKAFDYFLAKQNGGLPGKLPTPSYLTNNEEPSVVSQSRPEQPVGGGASTKMMITKADEGNLAKLGYTPEDIYTMKPQEAGNILDNKIQKPLSQGASEVSSKPTEQAQPAVPDQKTRVSQQLLQGVDTTLTDNGQQIRKPQMPESLTQPISSGVEGESSSGGIIPPSRESQQYLDELKTQQDQAREGEKLGIGQKIGKLYQSLKTALIDSNAPIEDVLNSAEKQGNFQVRPTSDVRLQIDRVLRAPTLAGQFAKDNGLVDVIRKAPDVQALDQYMIAKQAATVAKNGIETGRDLGKDQKLIQELAPTYEPFAQKVNQYSQRLLDYSVQSGLISKEAADALKVKYPEYVPLNRIFSEDELANPTPSGRGGGIASLSKQTVVQKLEGSKREIENPVASLLTKTQTAFEQGEKNIAARQLASYKDLPNNPFEITPLRTAENVTKRIDLYQQAAELKPLQTKAQQLLTTRNGWARNLQSAINVLNKKGLYLSLKDNAAPETQPLTAKLWTKTVAEQVKPNAPVSIDGLNNSYAVKDLLTKEYGQGIAGMKKLAADVFSGGWNQLLALNPDMNATTAKSVVNQIFKDPTIIPASIERKVLTVQPSAQQVKQLVNNLVNLPSSDIEKIKGMIATRENKLGGVLDMISNLSDSLEAIKGVRGKMFDEAKLLADAESRGKTTFSVLNNGIKEIYETTPEVAAAAKSLDKQQMNIVLKILSYPTRILRLGATGLNATFAASNLLKDQASAFINSGKTGAPNPIDWAKGKGTATPVAFVKGLFAALGHGKLYDDMVRNAAGGTSFDIGRENPNLSVAKIRSGKNIATTTAYIATNPKEWITAAENLIGRTEELTRAQQYHGTYDALISQGRTPEDAKLLAAKAARDNTVNFARGGNFSRVLNTIVPYFNAGIQGSRTLVRNVQNRPIQTLSKFAIGVGLPVAAATIWNTSDPQRKAAYDDIPEFEKQNSIILLPPVPTKDPTTGKWNVIKIPLSQEIASLTTFVRRPIEQAAGLDPVKVSEMANALFQSATSLNTSSPSQFASSITPQGLKPIVEGITNKNLFTGREIVPSDMRNLPPEQQVKKGTSGTARIIGKVLNTSPLMVENQANTLAGGLGSQLLNTSDQILNKAGVIPDNQVGGKGVGSAFENRFFKASAGDTQTKLDQQLRQGLTPKETQAYDYIHTPRQVDENGNPIPDNSVLASQAKANLYLTYPKLQEIDRQKALATPNHDPIWDLPQDQRNLVLAARTALPNQTNTYKQQLSKTNWYSPFLTQESQFFSSLPNQSQPTTDRPVPSAYVQQQLDAKNFRDPQVKAYLDANTAYKNSQLNSIGLASVPSGGSSLGGSSVSKYLARQRIKNTIKKVKGPKVKVVRGKVKRVKLLSKKPKLVKPLAMKRVNRLTRS